MNILFVCTGNTCRSCMAEALARQQALARDCSDSIFSSAGLSAVDGAAASPQAVAVLAEQGIDLSGHQARLLREEMLEWADLVLTMSRLHRNIIVSLAPQNKGKVYTLNEYAQLGDTDITDPFGGSQEQYRECAEAIDKALRKIWLLADWH